MQFLLYNDGLLTFANLLASQIGQVMSTAWFCSVMTHKTDASLQQFNLEFMTLENIITRSLKS